MPIDTLLVYLRKGKCVEDFRGDFPTVSREQAEALLILSERERVSATSPEHNATATSTDTCACPSQGNCVPLHPARRVE